ncbi:MAG: hypothetical protein KJO13_06045 [Gammaproteobacteria bacterium]|nr:hypothetical protein [Gammaproteobacteria bacterium]
MKFRVVSLVSLLLLMTAGPAGAAADWQDTQFRPLDKRFQAYLGGFFPEVDTTISINGEILPDNPEINFEDVFGLEDSKTVLWGGARWRISRRNYLEFEFFNLNRDGSTTLVTPEVPIDDLILEAGAQVDTTFDTTLGRLTYGFAVVSSDRMNIQLKAGLHIADLKTTLQATGAVCVAPQVPPNCPTVSTPESVAEDVTAPLPHFGGSFVYGITPSVAARFQIIGFAIELDKIDGSIVEVDADLVWNPWENFGFGAGIRYFNTNVEGKGSDLNGSFEFEYFGPALYVIGSF